MMLGTWPGRYGIPPKDHPEWIDARCTYQPMSPGVGTVWSSVYVGARFVRCEVEHTCSSRVVSLHFGLCKDGVKLTFDPLIKSIFGHIPRRRNR